MASRASAGSLRWRPTASPVNKMELPLNSSFMTMLTALSFSKPDRPDQSGVGLAEAAEESEVRLG